MAAAASAEDAQSCSSRRKPTLATSCHLDALQGMDNQVHARIADHLRGVPAASFSIMNDESDPDDVAQAQVRRKPKGMSGRLRMADTIVMLQVIWPYKVIYTHSGQPAACNQLDSMAFINGYLKSWLENRNRSR